MNKAQNSLIEGKNVTHLSRMSLDEFKQRQGEMAQEVYGSKAAMSKMGSAMGQDHGQAGQVTHGKEFDSVSKAASQISKAELVSNQQALDELRSKVGLFQISKTRPGETNLDKISVITPNYTQEAAGAQSSF